MENYPNSGLYGVENLFLAFAGYSVGADGTEHLQTWDRNDFLPIVTHIDYSSGQANGAMFTDFLFLAIAVKNSAGVIKYLVRNDDAPGSQADWQIYLNELFIPGKNLSALALAAQHNGLGYHIPVDIWVGLPYPHPKLFDNDAYRVSAVKLWINSFIANWLLRGYSKQLSLRGFYWVQESDYYQGPNYHDSFLMAEVNKYVQQHYLAQSQLKTLWIPYQKAAHWDKWRSFGFNLSILQPSYYFDPAKSLEAGAADAFVTQQGVELELDLAVLSDQAQRSRFIEYLDKGTTGGYDAEGRYFAPYHQQAALAWYTGGWYWSGETRKHAILSLYTSKDPLYNFIWEYVKGTYRAGSAY